MLLSLSKHFCGNKDYNYNGKDRHTIKRIDTQYTEAFKQFLDNNKRAVVDLNIKNGFDIATVVYNTYQLEVWLTYQRIIDKIEQAGGSSCVVVSPPN